MTSMKLPDNPFFTGISMPDRFFCDRKSETEKLVYFINNGYNIVLKSPRRLGKSSLLQHLFCQTEIETNYNTLYVDIYGTKSFDDFLQEFQNAFLTASFARAARGKKAVESLLKSLYLELNTSFYGDVGGFRLGVGGDGKIQMSLRALFDFLEKTKKPNIVVFDEFQQIQQYPERMAAILRSFTQRAVNTRFIFSGSSRHILSQMFDSSNEPFYKSARTMDLDIISLDSYTDFCKRMFSIYGKAISDEAVAFTYYLFWGNTYDMQQVMKELFALTGTRIPADRESVLSAIRRLIKEKENDFRENLNRLDNQKERKVLYCIAREGLATGLTSGAMIKRYNLDTASSVQNALRNLCGDKLNIAARVGGSHYRLQDKFFELWIADVNHFWDSKVDNPEQLFRLFRSLEC